MTITYPPEMLPGPDWPAEVIVFPPDAESRLVAMRDALVARRTRLAETMQCLRAEMSKIDRQLEDCAAAARVFQIKWPEQEVAGSRTLRDAVVECLEEAGSAGTTTQQMRPKVERLFHGPFHEKSIGVVLFRLKTQGLVERVGTRLWRSKASSSREGK